VEVGLLIFYIKHALQELPFVNLHNYCHIRW